MSSVDHYSYERGYEDAVNLVFRAQVETLCNLIRHYPQLWQYGDGYGGHVRLELEKAFDAYGFPRYVPEPSSGRSRKPISKAKIIAAMQKSGGACVACGSPDQLQVDHIEPHSRGGTDDIENLQMLCKPCNSSKRDKTMQEWAGDAA